MAGSGSDDFSERDELAPPKVSGSDEYGAVCYGELPYVHASPRMVRSGRRVLVAVGSVAVGALAAGGATYVLTGGGGGSTLALAGLGSSPSGSAEGADRTQDVSRYEGRSDLCVRLDGEALAAIEAARAAGAGAVADGRSTVKVRTEDGDVVVSMAAVTVVQCTWPSADASPGTKEGSQPPVTGSLRPKPLSPSVDPRSATTPPRTKPAPTTPKPPKAPAPKPPAPKPPVPKPPTTKPAAPKPSTTKPPAPKPPAPKPPAPKPPAPKPTASTAS